MVCSFNHAGEWSRLAEFHLTKLPVTSSDVPAQLRSLVVQGLFSITFIYLQSARVYGDRLSQEPDRCLLARLPQSGLGYSFAPFRL